MSFGLRNADYEMRSLILRSLNYFKPWEGSNWLIYWFQGCKRSIWTVPVGSTSHAENKVSDGQHYIIFSASFQIFSILLYIFYWNWFIKPNFCGSSDTVFNQCQRNKYSDIWGGGGGGVWAEARFLDRHFFSEKYTWIRHFARFIFSRL